MKSYLFSFPLFIEESRSNPAYSEAVVKYEKYFGPFTTLKNTKFYQYIRQFKIPSELLDHLRVPEGLEDDFNYKLLLKMVAGSFSSFGQYNITEDNQIDFLISVTSGDNTVVKSLFDLWGLQIFKLYEIYISELINFTVMMHEDWAERKNILAQQQRLVQEHKVQMQSLQEELFLIEINQ
jgi:hypothetical protein